MGNIRYDDAGAFGNPDGSRENFARFIDLDSEGLSQVNPSYVDKSISHRVIVGAKGSGKTLYIRKMEDDAKHNDGIVVIRNSNNLPTTDSILGIHKMYQDHYRTEQWQIIWRRAIFLSIASQYYCEYEGDERLKSVDIFPKKTFFDTFKNILPKNFSTPVSIFSQISWIIVYNGSSYNQLKSYIERPDWDSLESIIISILKKSPPLVYFIDAIDEELRHAPAAWMDFQKGLFYQVMRMLRDNDLGGRLHVIICIRDLVYSSVLQSEHAGRYVKDEHIKILHWSRNTAKEFLRKKIEKLHDDFFIDKNEEKNLKNLLGFDVIRNKKRGINENVEDYILRHTRYFPRDLINIGNSICQEVLSQRGDKKALSADAVARSISGVSSLIARETLAVCGNNIAVSSLPRSALRQDVLDSFSENPIVADQMKNIIYSFLSRIGKDVFSYDDLDDALNAFQEPLERVADKNKYIQYRIDTVLWQHGLIGYKNNSRDLYARFKNSSPVEPFNLPMDKPCYVFHSCIHDEVTSIKFKKGRPNVCE